MMFAQLQVQASTFTAPTNLHWGDCMQFLYLLSCHLLSHNRTTLGKANAGERLMDKACYLTHFPLLPKYFHALLSAPLLPFSHGTEAPHLAEGETGVIGTQVGLVLIEAQSLIPVIETLIPLLLHLLHRN